MKYAGNSGIGKRLAASQERFRSVALVAFCSANDFFFCHNFASDRLCGLVVRVPGYKSRGSIPGAARFSEK
jgi:hypothetical protein